MKLFRYDEYRYYTFGLRVGIANFIENRFKIGLKKTTGKIAQPVNSYTRFPEYYFMDRSIDEYIRRLSARNSVKILDVGSPKLFGFYLASRFNVDMYLTDISSLNLKEYELVWKALKSSAKGNVMFSTQDARSLVYKENEFDIVYSMSVIEHFAGNGNDSRGIKEMIRVLKPGGLFVASVPFGKRYVEQFSIVLDNICRKTNDNDKTPRFFQRIYDKMVFEKTFLSKENKEVLMIQPLSIITVWRKNNFLLRSYGKLGENLRGILGFASPLLSAFLNQHYEGIYDAFEVRYSEISRKGDLYGDIIFSGTKTEQKT